MPHERRCLVCQGDLEGRAPKTKYCNRKCYKKRWVNWSPEEQEARRAQLRQERREREGRYSDERTAEYKAAQKLRMDRFVASKPEGWGEQEKARKAALYQANRAENRKRNAEWAKAHPERMAEMKINHEHKRRAWKLGQAWEDVKKSVVWERDGGVCRLCGLPADAQNWHLEHLTPLSRQELNPTHTYDNVAVSHPRCNERKGKKTLDEWFALSSEWRA